MKASGPGRPLCKVCGHNHSGREAHVFVGGSADTKAKQVVPSQPSITGRSISPVPSQPSAEDAALKARIAELEAENATLKSADEDRRRAHREKMAARRSKPRTSP